MAKTKSKVYTKIHESDTALESHVKKIKKRGGKILEKAKIGIPKKNRVKYQF